MGEPVQGSGEIPLEVAPGTLVGEYEIGALLGKGGFGSVYAAAHPVIGKQVAIKVLSLRYSVDRTMVSRFIAEARAVNQIRHQHIIDIFSHGKLPDGRRYYVMELLEGETLDRYLKERGKLAVTEALELLYPIALALDAAHAAGIVHRDLKPENVFIARDAMGRPFPKLLDFGLAKLMGPELSGVDHSTQSGLMMGTPAYMSPEQCRGREVDHRTDLYALGAMTFQLLTGRVPFAGADHMDIIVKHLNTQPPRPSDRGADLTADGDEAILAMLAKDATDRPDTALEAINALASAQGVAPLATPSVKPVLKRPVVNQGELATANLGKAAVAPTLGAGEPTAEPAPPTVSLPMDEVSPPHPAGKRRRWIYRAAALALLGGGLATWKLAGSTGAGAAAAIDPPAASLDRGGADRPWARGVSASDQASALELFVNGNTQLENGDSSAAVQTYEQALTHWDHPAIHYNLALAQMNLDDQPLAVDDHFKAAMQFGAAPLGVDTFERAMKSRERNAKEIGSEASKHGLTRQRAGDFVGAAEAYKQAYDRDTEDPDRRAEYAHNLLSEYRHIDRCDPRVMVMFKRYLELKSTTKPLSQADLAMSRPFYEEIKTCRNWVTADDALSPTVKVHIDGVPAGTEVLDDKGKTLGEVPGDVAVPRGPAIAVGLVHPGYDPLPLTIDPDRVASSLHLTLIKHVPKESERVGNPVR